MSLIGAFITLILNWLWIPTYSYVGSAWATLICYFSMAVMSYWLGQKYYPVPYPLKRIASFLALSLSIYIISEMLKEALALTPSVSIAFNTVLFGIYLYIIFKMEEQEINKFLVKSEKY